MSLIWIFLIIIGSSTLFVVLISVLKRITQPKFPKETMYEYKKNESEQNVSGLSFTDSYISENPEYVEQAEEPLEEKIDFPSFDRPFKFKKEKTILEQFGELSPEMKILFLDRVLARKDVEFKSKKN